ncbi:MAG: hypothetical protein R3B82_03430 [Sandaracinaceae bacterium]
MRPSKLFHTVVIVGAALTGGCGDGTSDTDAGAIADAAMDAAAAVDAGEPVDAGEEEDAMVLIL